MSRLTDLYGLRAQIDAEIRTEQRRLSDAGTTDKCGTESGYQRHHHRRDPDCEPCRQAHADHNRAKAATKRLLRPGNDVDPVAIERVFNGELVPTTRAERREIVRRWTETGRPLAELERITGWNVARMLRAVAA